MAVYVDDGRYRVPRRPGPGYMIMCHMVADSLDELHAMADAIGVSRRWFQSGRRPHYDVCLAMRRRALDRGAQAITQRQAVAVLRRLRESQTADFS